MYKRNLRNLRDFLCAFLLMFLAATPLWAQQDPNPDSPTPVLATEPNSNRALAISAEAQLSANVTKTLKKAFQPDTKVLLYVKNLELIEGESASALRINVYSADGRNYRFPVLKVKPAKNQPGVYAVTILLRDELGFWEPLKADGDILISLAWRGLESNRVRLGLGRTGGALKDVPETKLAQPAFDSQTFPASKNGRIPELNYAGYKYSGDRIRFLEQATFGPTPALDDRIRRIGLRTWLAEQFTASYPTYPYPNYPLLSNNTDLGCPAGSPSTCIRDNYTMYQVQNWFFKEAFYGEAQLKHKVAWALSQIWVISGIDTQQASYMFAYHQLLSKNAFGNYRDLMYDITLNPGMGNYLDMVRSTKNNPNENFAREILQLFSIGLFMLNQDGTLQLDEVGKPIPTYDQNTVNNFTKVLTGWGFCEVSGPTCPNRTVGAQNYKDPLILTQNNHDVTSKTLLNYPNAVNSTISANQNGATELNQALDNIFNHPNVAPFVSRILIQHLVTSDPTPAYVGRVAAAFNNNGSNVRGDMKAVISAILLDPEARGNIKTDPNFGKLREPVQLATNLLRQFGVQSATAGGQSDGYVNQLISPMGQNTFYAPTVFNYYPPDYFVPGTALNGPEFNILTTGTAIARANFVNTMLFSRVNVSSNAPLGTSLNLTDIQALAASDASGSLLVDTLNTKMMHGAMTADMRNTILTAIQAVPSTNSMLRAQTAIYLIATSSQYQVQR